MKITLKNRAQELLLAQIIGDTGYNYVINSKGDLVVHPVVENIGRNIKEYDFARQQMVLKEGYLEYEWKNPNEDVERSKALYMVYFEPWDWIISVSSYRDEFHQLVDTKDFENNIKELKFGKSGYSYILSDAGDIIVHPLLKVGEHK